jgi:hypothetical protein
MLEELPVTYCDREDAVAPHFPFPYPNVQPTGRSAIVGGVKPTLTKRFDGDIAPKCRFDRKMGLRSFLVLFQNYIAVNS